MKPSDSSKGFTLVETLVAMMILSIALVTIFQLFSGGLKSVRISDGYSRAVFYAREKMEEFLLADEMSDADLDGFFYDGYRWQARIRMIGDDADEAGGEKGARLFRVSVTVEWNDGFSERDVSFDTVHLAGQADVEKAS